MTMLEYFKSIFLPYITRPRFLKGAVLKSIIRMFQGDFELAVKFRDQFSPVSCDDENLPKHGRGYLMPKYRSETNLQYRERLALAGLWHQDTGKIRHQERVLKLLGWENVQVIPCYVSSLIFFDGSFNFDGSQYFNSPWAMVDIDLGEWDSWEQLLTPAELEEINYFFNEAKSAASRRRYIILDIGNPALFDGTFTFDGTLNFGPKKYYQPEQRKKELIDI